MSLSNDLISQFVKVTRDKDSNKQETTVYGTTKEYPTGSGKFYVVLDGSNELTPFETTTDVADGERISLTIRNHKAIANGNLSSPSARTDDLKDVATNVEDAITEVNNLKADNVEIKGSLNSVNASIQNLEADHGDFKTLTTEQITSINAAIENLEAGTLTVEQLKSTFATIAQLDAEKARIGDLESATGDIKTLIFGSATGTTIQSSFANAVIAQLGDAQIKSAMIESVSADKITSGDIVTNNVRVLSEDGKLLISDETIQISDDTRVRVQIGKDSSGDYSISVWDVEGNLMFSEGGITDSAIKEAIIRNDMVADDANIAAHKLDIDSLFTEINGSDKTINSTRVYLDDENQTLDVAFKSMSTDVDGLQNDVTSQGTAISIIQGQIESKIWEQDIDTATGELSTQYSTLSQDLSGFKSTVSSTYATQKSVSDLGDASIVSVSEEYSTSEDPNEVPTSGWSTVSPSYNDGLYVWRRTTTTYGNGRTETSEPVMVTGNTGRSGEDAVLLRIESSRGTVFKNDDMSTVLSVVIYKGSERITTMSQLSSTFGSGAYLQWKWQRIDDNTFGVISSTDKMISNNGFTLTISPSEVDTKVTFMCELII